MIKIEDGKVYTIKAKSKVILFLPNGKCFDYGSSIEGNFSASTLNLIKDNIEIEEIKVFSPNKKEEKPIVSEKENKGE